MSHKISKGPSTTRMVLFADYNQQYATMPSHANLLARILLGLFDQDIIYDVLQARLG